MSVAVAVRYATLLILLSSWSGTVFAAEDGGPDAAAGRSAYAVCAACHGQQGEGNMAMNAPKLAGLETWYLARSLDAYKRGLRGTAKGDVYGAQMRPMAMAVSDPTAVDNLIAYIATLPELSAESTVTGDAAAGKTAYMVCAACHGPDAQGLEQMGGPRLAGQSDWYLVRQLNYFRDGRRGYSPQDVFGNQMKPMAMTLADPQAINDVVAYINTLD